jgi:hypothetical protein
MAGFRMSLMGFSESTEMIMTMTLAVRSVERETLLSQKENDSAIPWIELEWISIVYTESLLKLLLVEIRLRDEIRLILRNRETLDGVQEIRLHRRKIDRGDKDRRDQDQDR